MANIFNQPITQGIQSARPRARPLPNTSGNAGGLGDIFGGLDLQALSQGLGQPLQQGGTLSPASRDFFSDAQPDSLGLVSGLANQAASSQPSATSSSPVDFGLGDLAKVAGGFLTGNVGGAVKGIAKDKVQQGITANVQANASPQMSNAFSAALTGFKLGGPPAAVLNAVASQFGVDVGSLASGLKDFFGQAIAPSLNSLPLGMRTSAAQAMGIGPQDIFSGVARGSDEGGVGEGSGGSQGGGPGGENESGAASGGR